jgi:hypothetical protein
VDVLEFGSATTAKGTTSVAPQARKRGNRRVDCRKMPHAQPWKSGASAPRKAPKEATGLQPQWMFRPASRARTQAPHKLLSFRIGLKARRGTRCQPTPPRREGSDLSRPASLKTDACSTVEERRFSAALSTPKATGLQPQWTSFASGARRPAPRLALAPPRCGAFDRRHDLTLAPASDRCPDPP